MGIIVDQQVLMKVLKDLAEEFGARGRIYLTGSAALIFEGLRSASVDIDYSVDVAPELVTRFEAAARVVARRRGVALEIVSLSGWIVLPAGWEGRCQYLHSFGELDVYAFDPYSLSLSKLLRGREPDIKDVAGLCLASRVDLQRLGEMVEWLIAQWSPVGWHAGAGDRDTLRAKLEGHFAAAKQLLRSM